MPGRHRTGARALGAVTTAAANALTLSVDARRTAAAGLTTSGRLAAAWSVSPPLREPDRGDRSELPFGVTVLVVGLRWRRSRRGRRPRRRRIDLIVGLARTPLAMPACPMTRPRGHARRGRDDTKRHHQPSKTRLHWRSHAARGKRGDEVAAGGSGLKIGAVRPGLPDLTRRGQGRRRSSWADAALPANGQFVRCLGVRALWGRLSSAVGVLLAGERECLCQVRRPTARCLWASSRGFLGGAGRAARRCRGRPGRCGGASACRG